MNKSKNLFKNDTILEKLPMGFRLLTRVVPEEVEEKKGGLGPAHSEFHRSEQYTVFASARPISKIIPDNNGE